MTQADEFPEQRYWPPVLSSLAFKHGTIMVRVMAYNRTVKEGDEVPVNDLAAFFKWREREAEAKEEPPHGTIARYTSHRFPCRCGECRLAMRDYMREYRRIRRMLQGVDR